MPAYWKDVIERLLRTALQGAIYAALADGVLDLSMSGVQAAGTAGILAGLSFIMSLVGKPIGDPDSASVLATPAPSPPRAMP